ncbi:hypothetical protein QC763_0025920 [Podospora pseudopauciseta]|uniref:Zn(2)-C6 fungal-type domain-containing protein n=2 Tax=Podospora TaxID=5144 RepID=A0ABR0I308_9PEZI|nr:hypothetical protein QC763_0025920 [Podospora pseudopauciseta]KAK4683089.1 hypothetical protein QC764_0025830 [Podospora pseudoanserina]
MEELPELADNNDHSAKRACDQCRQRKIRCDKELPVCSNCRTASRSCSSTGLGQKPREPRQRVLITHQYERKIDSLDSRLGAIEKMLHNLTVSLNNRGPPTASSSISPTLESAAAASSSAPRENSTDALFGADKDNESDDFEATALMKEHTAFATQFIENTTFPFLDPEMRAAFLSLQELVKLQNIENARHDARFTTAKPLPKGGWAELPMPSADIVLSVLREIKQHPPMGFPAIATFTGIEDFPDNVRRVYFATEEYSLMQWGIVNLGLYFTLQERGAASEGDRQVQLFEASFLCRDNIETALTNLPLLLPQRRESVELLIMATMYAIEESKYSLARDFITIAANICQTLGYHRARSPSTTESEHKAMLFWTTYIFDSALSLRAGRPTAIQDWDITIPREIGPKVKNVDPLWKIGQAQWISWSEVMGRTYRELYSPEALARTAEKRAENARQLAQALQDVVARSAPLIEHVVEKMKMSGGYNAQARFSFDIAVVGDALVQWSVLTLIYRAIPTLPGSPSTFNPECIHAAREAFSSHEGCMALCGESLFMKAGYIQWNILYIPFIPLVVLFCHTIETANEEDFAILVRFTEGLQPVAPVSSGVTKLYRISQVLVNIASLWLQTRKQGQQDHNMSMVGDNVEMYLNQLGFMPQHSQQDHTYGIGGPAGFGYDMDQSAQLANWFSGNTHIFGLMEEDLSGFQGF